MLPIIEAYFHPVNKNLTPPDLNQTVWRIMRLGRFEQLIEHRGLWFARFDEMEDKEECRIPEKNLRPTIDALISAGIPVHMAHAEGMREVAGKAFWARVTREKPCNLINCWYLGEQPSEELWMHSLRAFRVTRDWALGSRTGEWELIQTPASGSTFGEVLLRTLRTRFMKSGTDSFLDVWRREPRA